MQFFHTFHKASKILTAGPKNMRDWPEAWRKPLYKMYEGARQHALPRDTNEYPFVGSNIRSMLLSRRSRRNVSEYNLLTEKSVGNLLALACGETGEMLEGSEGKMRRTYASAGGLYPVETYVLLCEPAGMLPRGLYHYRVDLHALEMLEDDLADLAISELFAHDWPRHAPMTIFLTGIPERVVHKYGERGYRFMLLEAGHIGANLMLVIEAMGLSTVEIGGTHDEHIESFLDVDGINEVLLSTFVVGARGADVSSNNNSKNI